MHLEEVASDARRLVDRFRAGDFDSHESASDLHIELAHLMSHLAMTWHWSIRTDAEIDALSTEQHGKLMNAIPQFGINQQMVDPWEKVV